MPSTMPALRTSSTESITSATSASRTAAPLLYATINGRYWSALSSWSLALSDQELVWSATSPLGRFALACSALLRTCSRLMP